MDEVQNVPELFNYLRTRIDRVPRRCGQWLLTGSQDAPLMRGVSESMAGRVAVFHLLPLSLQETSRAMMGTSLGYSLMGVRPLFDADWNRARCTPAAFGPATKNANKPAIFPEGT